MAFNISIKDTIKVISKLDTSIIKKNDAYSEAGGFSEAWENYLKDYDESFLKFDPSLLPTRFILKLVLNYKAKTIVENMKLKVTNGEASLQMAFMMEEVRLALVDIENPCEPIVFKKDADGFASKELIALLSSDHIGVTSELYIARNNFGKDKSEANLADAKKN